MLEYKKTPGQRLMDAIEHDIQPLPPRSSLDRYNKEELRQILKDWVLIYEKVNKRMLAHINDVGSKEESTKQDLLLCAGRVSHYAGLLGGVRKAWEELTEDNPMMKQGGDT